MKQHYNLHFQFNALPATTVAPQHAQLLRHVSRRQSNCISSIPPETTARQRKQPRGTPAYTRKRNNSPTATGAQPESNVPNYTGTIHHRLTSMIGEYCNYDELRFNDSSYKPTCDSSTSLTQAQYLDAVLPNTARGNKRVNIACVLHYMLICICQGPRSYSSARRIPQPTDSAFQLVQALA